MKLSEGYCNRKYVVEKIIGSNYMNNMLLRMQIQKGSIITLLRKHRFFSYIVEVETSRVCFDESVANKIMVIPYV